MFGDIVVNQVAVARPVAVEGKDGSAEAACKFHGVHRAALAFTFHHDDLVGHSHLYASSGYQCPRTGHSARRLFAYYQSSVSDYVVLQSGILLGMHSVETRADNSDSPAASVKTSAMGGGVDTQSKSANHDFR